MKYKRFKKIKKQYNYYKIKELLKIQLKVLIQFFINSSYNHLFLYKFYNSNFFVPRNNLRNFCIMTGRSRNLNRDFHVSRIAIRDLSSSRVLLGLRKTS